MVYLVSCTYSAWALSFFLGVRFCKDPNCKMSVGQGSTLFLFIHLPTAEPRGRKKSRTMKKDEKKKEELQSRREFFKKAAKAALPVVGAVVLSSLPVKEVQAQYYCGVAATIDNLDYIPAYCRGTCSGTCARDCGAICQNSCRNTCEGCRDSCYGSCRGSCYTSCRYSTGGFGY